MRTSFFDAGEHFVRFKIDNAQQLFFAWRMEDGTRSQCESYTERDIHRFHIEQSTELRDNRLIQAGREIIGHNH